MTPFSWYVVDEVTVTVSVEPELVARVNEVDPTDFTVPVAAGVGRVPFDPLGAPPGAPPTAPDPP